MYNFGPPQPEEDINNQSNEQEQDAQKTMDEPKPGSKPSDANNQHSNKVESIEVLINPANDLGEHMVI